MNKNFYEKCQRLRDYYRETNVSNQEDLNLAVLSKLIVVAFSNTIVSDTLPVCRDLVLDCTDLRANYERIEDALTRVLKDLEYTSFVIFPVKPFYMSHSIDVKII